MRCPHQGARRVVVLAHTLRHYPTFKTAELLVQNAMRGHLSVHLTMS